MPRYTLLSAVCVCACVDFDNKYPEINLNQRSLMRTPTKNTFGPFALCLFFFLTHITRKLRCIAIINHAHPKRRVRSIDNSWTKKTVLCAICMRTCGTPNIATERTHTKKCRYPRDIPTGRIFPPSSSSSVHIRCDAHLLPPSSRPEQPERCVSYAQESHAHNKKRLG